ncbi:MAG: methylated-DNA--[protein]-cysteine S-methyltransferase [Deltaproteobacteria bacterium]|nr:methylated-DNA--[protein]-cysteine S-methyltransferase [Deltaproteobacteria bacterium]MBW2047104.1 methylated-DNA--[protein]-cysteine S-methyltransferase [Deltaproteobacteria bacterium]MBW2110222.1 methylated-DNA--[protein]-cysteine S-methyltransferase [Deltaproteobacteria bacterium]MBW2351645.1 methylated-DNA--[protein]-cysteine S-methyltransferase [Deltaproteobacteria bacterium]HDZ90669.1 methylated-DNA--[protein]-cysteine S-methyltransferase [Deltaproteobacteria bacterium]
MAGKKVPEIYCWRTRTGRLTVYSASTERGAIRTCLEIDGCNDPVPIFKRLFPRAMVVEDYSMSQPVVKAVEAALSNRSAEALPPMDLRVTPFQRSVLEAITAIPYGETKTYGEVAAMVGKPAGARAVGQVMGKNPLPLIFP